MFNIKTHGKMFEVFYSAGVFRYRMFSPDTVVLRPAQKGFSSKVPVNILNALNRQIHQMVKSGCSTGLKETGNLLYRQLIPDELSDILSTGRQNLYIISEDQSVPWELLHDGNNFWGIGHSIGRCLVANGKIRKSPVEVKRDTACLIIANPTGDLKDAEIEAVTLMKFLRGRNIRCCYLGGSQATVDDILVELNSSKYDFIHYSGHIIRSPANGEYSFALANNEYFPVNSINRLSFGAPLVFLNGCGSAKIDNMELYDTLETNIEGVAIPFIYAGARAVIGTSWKVSDPGARRFAEILYTYILDGDTVGEAMAKTRKTMWEESTDISWASFVLYGNPGLYFYDMHGMPDLPSDLERKSFSNKGWKIIKHACSLAPKSRFITTIHLFDALVGLNAEIAGQFLREIRISPGEAKALLNKAVSLYEQNSGDGSKSLAALSLNTEKILIAANLLAANRKTLIGPDELLAAFHTVPDAGVYRIFGAICGIDGRKTEGTAINEKDTGLFDEHGNLYLNLFSSDFHKSLWFSLHFAGEGLVSTTHLFSGMLANSSSMLPRLLDSMGISSVSLETVLVKVLGRDEDLRRCIKKPVEIGRSKFSSNSLKALAEACIEAKSQNGRIKEKNVLKALLGMKCSVGYILDRMGIDTEKLADMLDRGMK